MNLIRPLLRNLHAYVPGEQPKIKGLIKLNTNENPYPPSPKVLAAVKNAADARLRLYPNPAAQPLREALARLHQCSPDQILVGNGSDEILALATRAFAEPLTTRVPASKKSSLPLPASPALSRQTIQFFTPSYSLYPVLASIHGTFIRDAPLESDFAIPPIPDLKRGKRWDFKAALTFITTPNAPSGRGYATSQLEALCRAQKGVVLLDEAYVDFAGQNAMRLALALPNVLVARTFSKAYSLCFQRVGYCVGPANLIAALDKIRDSYNVNGLGQAAALATLADLPYYQKNFQRIIASRTLLGEQLTALGFKVLPSQTNFLLAEPPVLPAQEWLEKLREEKILVRWFSAPAIKRFLRITIGSERETAALIRSVRRILGRV